MFYQRFIELKQYPGIFKQLRSVVVTSPYFVKIAKLRDMVITDKKGEMFSFFDRLQGDEERYRASLRFRYLPVEKR